MLQRLLKERLRLERRRKNSSFKETETSRPVKSIERSEKFNRYIKDLDERF